LELDNILKEFKNDILANLWGLIITKGKYVDPPFNSHLIPTEDIRRAVSEELKSRNSFS
jgi:hypothetical protein